MNTIEIILANSPSIISNSFLFIFLGGPYIEKFRDNARLSAALSSITAAVVGVVLNLAVWFGLQVILPGNGRIDVFAALIGLAAFGAVQWLKIGIIWVILAAGTAGLYSWWSYFSHILPFS